MKRRQRKKLSTFETRQLEGKWFWSVPSPWQLGQSHVQSTTEYPTKEEAEKAAKDYIHWNNNCAIKNGVY